MGLIYRPETSIHSSRHTLRNNPEEQSNPDEFCLLELQILDTFALKVKATRQQQPAESEIMQLLEVVCFIR